METSGRTQVEVLRDALKLYAAVRRELDAEEEAKR